MRSSTRTEASRTVPAPPLEAMPLESLFQELRSGQKQAGSLLGTNMGSALESVMANRVRSFLTILGIVIGIAAVIGAISLAQGVGIYFSTAIAGLGSNTVLISGSPSLNSGAQERAAQAAASLAHLRGSSGDKRAPACRSHQPGPFRECPGGVWGSERAHWRRRSWHWFYNHRGLADGARALV